jgi:hypothetical protein
LELEGGKKKGTEESQTGAGGAAGGKREVKDQNDLKDFSWDFEVE